MNNSWKLFLWRALHLTLSLGVIVVVVMWVFAWGKATGELKEALISMGASASVGYWVCYVCLTVNRKRLEAEERMDHE